MTLKLSLVIAATLSLRVMAQDATLQPHQEAMPQPATNPPVAAIETPEPAAAVAAPAAPAAAESEAPLPSTITGPANIAPTPEPAPAPKPAAAPAAPRAPARKAAAKPSELKSTPLQPGPAVLVATRVNLRGKAGLRGEVIGRMTNGEPVTVLQEVHLKNSGPQEPSAWAKIQLPQKVHAWVFATYINPTNHTVNASQLNIRTGPGENYSVIGTLNRGEAVEEIRLRDHWMEIESPTNAYAFMAAQYLSQEPDVLAAAGIAPAAGATTAPAETVAVAEAPGIAEASTNEPAMSESMMDTNEMAEAEGGTNGAAMEEPAPPEPRIVQREGIVRYTASIQAPTIFQLISVDTGKPIDYLYTTSPNLDLNRYKGLRIVVTGEEGLDERWKSTPIITIQRIQVIE
jgi:uncharacterized protein YgiM (DUF1202 family)